jgi:hypothetical protein
VKEADKRRPGYMVKAMQQHEAYWDATSGKTVYFEHWRYGDGWHWGWCDARFFFAGRVDGVVPVARDAASHSGSDERDGDVVVGADKIGFLDLWILKRMRQGGIANKDIESCQYGWEWEHGFRRGVRDFETFVGIVED